MSTFLKPAESVSKPIRSADDLRCYFQAYAKPKGTERVGIECELFGVHAETGKALPYFGSAGIEAVLNELAKEFGYEPIVENAHTIALQKDEWLVSLEPGGQVELSAEPVKNIHEVRGQLDRFFFELKIMARFFPQVAWITAGIHPFSTLRGIEWVPKKRYEIMARYLGRRGKCAHDMMKRTCGNQVNLDYLSEEDAICKMRLSLAVTPIAAAMFAASSLSLGKLNGFASERLHIWRDTDPARTGLILNLICRTCTFQDYLNYVLDVPMMFLVRRGKWIVTPGLTFRKFIEKGHHGMKPTQDDFELHLSTIFTDVRFKQYVEIRGIDGQRNHLIPAVSAFWKGLFYDDEAAQKASRLMCRFREKEIVKLHHEVERKGLRAKIRGTEVLELARELVQISEEGLKRQRRLNLKEEDERVYLVPLKEEVLREGKTPADRLAELWRGSFHKNPRAVVDYLKI